MFFKNTSRYSAGQGFKIYIYYKIRHEAKAAYSQNIRKSLKTYNIIKAHAVHRYIIYNDNYKHIKAK